MKIVLANDGTEGYLVKVKEIPPAYWKEFSRAWFMNPGGVPPDEEGQGGARLDTAPESMVWIPRRFFGPVTNHLGEVSP